jgi:hypothetical protein
MSNNFSDISLPYFVKFPHEEQIYLPLLKEDSELDADHVMWSVALFIHPQSIYAKATTSERKQLIQQQFNLIN